jgi:hypothetical protein
VNTRRFSYLLSAAFAAALLLIASPAQAGKQATASNPPAALRPGQTKTVHEIGASLNGNFNPDAFMPAFNWRFHLPNTGRIGQLSGLYMGLNAGPAVSFHGRGLGRYDGPGYGRGGRDYYRAFGSLWGRAGFELGYEIDPWSNLALTFSPTVHNDFHFSPYFFQFEQTFGPTIRLYINQHWVVYFEPGFIGYSIWTNTDRRHPYYDDDDWYDGRNYVDAWLSVRGGVGFAYKF